jgi:hypothetical protein
MRAVHPTDKFINENGSGPGRTVAKAAPEEELEGTRAMLGSLWRR